jgi:tyrosine-protein phosphatase YwqE
MGPLDAHCHILPGLDDGPPDDRGALAIARLLVEMGVTKVVATPHVISDVYRNTTARIVEAVELLRRLLFDSGISLEVVAGAEYYAEAAFLALIERRDLLAFGDERYVLFESPVEHQPMILEEVGFSLLAAGYTPLLAHAERYRFLQQDHGLVEHLRRLGFRFQVNHPSFHLARTSQRGEAARWLYLRGYVDVLGTDMHRATSWDQLQRETTGRRTRPDSGFTR